MGVMPTLAQSTWPSSTLETAPQTQRPVSSPRPATALRLTSCTTRTSSFPDSKDSTLMTRRRPTTGSPLRRSRTSNQSCDRPSQFFRDGTFPEGTVQEFNAGERTVVNTIDESAVFNFEATFVDECAALDKAFDGQYLERTWRQLGVNWHYWDAKPVQAVCEA